MCNCVIIYIYISYDFLRHHNKYNTGYQPLSSAKLTKTCEFIWIYTLTIHFFSVATAWTSPGLECSCSFLQGYTICPKKKGWQPFVKQKTWVKSCSKMPSASFSFSSKVHPSGDAPRPKSKGHWIFISQRMFWELCCANKQKGHANHHMYRRTKE